MTAIPQSRPLVHPHRRRRVLLLAVLLIVVLAGAGAAAYFVHFRDAPPLPPDAPANENDPAVAIAVRLAREQVLKEPRSGTAWGELGEVFLANELDDESNLCFAQAERFDPKNPRWPYFRGGTILNQGNREGALSYFQRAADLDETAGDGAFAPRMLLAETLLALGRLDEAERHFRIVLDQQPGHVRAHYGMGLLAVARNEWAESRDHFRLGLGLPQAQQKACVQLAAVSQRLGADADADKYRQQADRLPKDLDWIDPYTTEYLKRAVKKRSRYRLVDNLDAAGHYAEAAEVLRPMTDDYPDDYLPQLSLAKELGRLGDSSRAERALRRALQLAPEKAQIHYYLSLILMMKGEELTKKGAVEPAQAAYREAVERARKALAITPDNGYAYMTLGQSLKSLGERSEALTALRQAVRCNPELAELHFFLGDLLAELELEPRTPGAVGKVAFTPGEARYHLEQALEFGPPQADWRKTAQDRLNALKKAVP